MASGDLSHQPPPFLAHFGNDCLGQNAGLVENRAAAMQLPQPEIIPRQWMPDERDAFISWLRGEFAAANAIIDAMCHHLRVTGEPGEYDFALACIQQRRYNWTVVLHLQQYFSVAEVVYALQQVTCRKQQARSTDLSHMQQARRFVEHSKEIRMTSIHGDPNREAFARSGSEMSVPDDAAASSNLSRGLRATFSRNAVNEDIPSGEGLQCRLSRADVRSSQEDRLARSGLDPPASELTDLDLSSSTPLKIAELPPGHDPQTDLENECSGSVSKSQDSVIPQSKKNEARWKGRDPNGSGSHGGRTKSLDARSPLCQQVYNIPRVSLDSLVGKLPKVDFNLPSKEEDESRLSMIKVSKQFQCWEQAEGNMTNVVDGLELYENVLNNFEAAQLANLVTELQAAGRRGELCGQTFVTDKISAAGRLKETIQFGHVFSGITEDSDSSGRSIEPMPAALQSLVDRLIRWQILPTNRVLDCCSIDILEEGAYSPPMHRTGLDRFFCCLSLMAECALVLGHNISMEQHGECKGPFNMVLPPGSLLILQGNSAEVANQGILASTRKRIIMTFAKVLVRKVAHTSSAKFTGTAPNTVATARSWLPVGQQGLGVASSSGRGLVPTVIKHHSIGTTSGVLPVPSVQSPSHVPQQIPQHLVTANLQTLFANPTGAAGYPTVGIMGQGWSAVPRPSRIISSGTGVFFPSSGPSGGPARPIGAPQLQTGLIMLPPLSQRADSLGALTSSQASNFVYPSNRVLRPSLSADQIDQFGERTASFLSPTSLGSNDSPRTICKEPANGSSPKSETNGNRNTNDEHQQRTFHHSKAGGGSKF